MSSLKKSSHFFPARLTTASMQFGSVVACIVLWHFASSLRIDLGIITFSNVPTPHAVVSAIWQLLQSNALLPHLGSSLARVFSGYSLAAIAGVGLGLAIGRSRNAENWLMPPLELLRPIPAVAWNTVGDPDVSFIRSLDDFYYVYRRVISNFVKHHPRR